MLFVERLLFPEKAARREEKRLREQEEKELHDKQVKDNLERRMMVNRSSQDYLSQLPVLESAEIVTLDEELGTTIQIYNAPTPTQTVLLVPGDGSTGQSAKYDWLIADLLKNGVSVARVNNESHIDFGMQDFLTPDDYLRTYHATYKKYMTTHFGVINKYLSANGFIDTTKKFNLIGSSAGATAILALYDQFDVLPQSLVLLGPSGDIAPQDALVAAQTYTTKGGRINVVVGQLDNFQRYEPFLSLKQMSTTTSNISVSKILDAAHDLRSIDPKGDMVQIGLHREIFRALDLPFDHFDEICGDFPYVANF